MHEDHFEGIPRPRARLSKDIWNNTIKENILNPLNYNVDIDDSSRRKMFYERTSHGWVLPPPFDPNKLLYSIDALFRRKRYIWWWELIYPDFFTSLKCISENKGCSKKQPLLKHGWNQERIIYGYDTW